MDITAANAAVSSQALTTTSTTSTAPSGAIEADFNTFLTLLTTQLRNQDPLNPTDSTEFVAQLASFSSVEQQTRTNSLLEDLLIASDDHGTLSNGLDWIGKDVAAPGRFDFDGSASETALLVTPRPSAQTATLSIYNDFGTVIATNTVDPSQSDLSWDGRNSSGELAPPGQYRATVTYVRDEVTLDQVEAQGFSRVDEIRTAPGGGLMLFLGNGNQVRDTEVTSIRS